MDLWQLHIFAAVVEHRSFSKASRSINLSQPTVSSHIKELEDHFGCRLLDRLGKTTEPTKAGQILFDYAKRLLLLRDQAETAVQDFLGCIKGELLLGGSTIPSAYIIPGLLGPFSKKFPDITIRLTAGDTMDIIQKIKKGKLEAGIVGAKTNDPAILQEELVQDEMKLIIPADHRWAGRSAIDASQLFQEKIIAREKGSGTWQSILQRMDTAGFDSRKLDTPITMGNTMSVIQGILNHIGVSILSTIAVREDVERGRLAALAVNGLNLDRFFYLTLPSRKVPSPVCEKFLDYARGSVP